MHAPYVHSREHFCRFACSKIKDFETRISYGRDFSHGFFEIADLLDRPGYGAALVNQTRARCELPEQDLFELVAVAAAYCSRFYHGAIILTDSPATIAENVFDNIDRPGNVSFVSPGVYEIKGRVGHVAVANKWLPEFRHWQPYAPVFAIDWPGMASEPSARYSVAPGVVPLRLVIATELRDTQPVAKAPDATYAKMQSDYAIDWPGMASEPSARYSVAPGVVPLRLVIATELRDTQPVAKAPDATYAKMQSDYAKAIVHSFAIPSNSFIKVPPGWVADMKAQAKPEPKPVPVPVPDTVPEWGGVCTGDVCGGTVFELAAIVFEDIADTMRDIAKPFVSPITSTVHRVADASRSFVSSRREGLFMLGRTSLGFAAGVMLCLFGPNLAAHLRGPIGPTISTPTTNAAMFAMSVDDAPPSLPTWLDVKIVDTLKREGQEATVVESLDGRRFVIVGTWGPVGDSFRAPVSELRASQREPSTLASLLGSD